MSNNNVIISTGRNVSRAHYHTTVCYIVWQIEGKSYISESAAKDRGYQHCDYCAGNFPSEKKPDSTLSTKLRKADPEEVFGDD